MEAYDSPSIQDAFAMGGGWMWMITLWGIGLIVMLVVQYVKREKVDFTPVILGILVSLALIGLVGTAVGIQQAGYALKLAAPERQLEAMSFGVAIALYTTVYSGILAFIGAFAFGFLKFKMKQNQPV